MNHHPKLEQFVTIKDHNHASFFKVEDIFQLIGKSLEQKLIKLLNTLNVADSPKILGEVSSTAIVEGAVYIAEGATIEPTAYIKGPCYIGKNVEVRHGAYIRGNCYIDDEAIIGHTTEVKGSIFFKAAKAAHFAYVGDSILGQNVNLGAGTKLANFKLTKNEIYYSHPQSEQKVATGLKKFGAILGDNTATGCNSVLSPGTLLFPNTAVLPCVHFRGTLKHGIAR